MFPINIDKITFKAINDYIKTPNLIEKQYFDFKENILEKEKLGKAIAGFANAGGGWLIFGIKENKNKFSIEGIPKTKGKQKISEWLSQNIATEVNPFPNYEIADPISIPSDNEKCIVVIYIPESSNKPHICTNGVFFLRKGENTVPASLFEIRDMFELSRRHQNDFDFFLHKRNLLDETLFTFGKNVNSENLKNNFSDNFSQNPKLIISFIPKYVNETIITTSHKVFIDWLNKNTNGYFPKIKSDLLKIMKRQNITVGITSSSSVKEVFTNIFTKANGLVIKYLETEYVEIQKNGYIEYGCQEPIIYPTFEHNKYIGIVNINQLIEQIWAFINFSIKFYNTFNTRDEIILQLSLIDVKNFMLFGNNKFYTKDRFYVAKNENFNTQERNIKLSYKFNRELNDENIKELMREISIQIHNSFGLLDDTYFTN